MSATSTANMDAKFGFGGARPRLQPPITLVVIPDECQSIPITAPNDWNQKGGIAFAGIHPVHNDGRRPHTGLHQAWPCVLPATAERARYAAEDQRYLSVSPLDQSDLLDSLTQRTFQDTGAIASRFTSNSGSRAKFTAICRGYVWG